jgi:N-acetylglucosaminyl-diphospho-decaprenol L-rhamnosyltransferase
VAADLSVIVVSYDAREHLERCLETVAGRGLDVIVVDNASSDGSPELVRDRFPDVRLVELPENVGFGAANNAGFEVARGEWLLLLNSDAWPVGDGIERLVAFARGRPRAGAVGPRLVRPSGELELSVRGFPTVWRLATEYLFLRRLAPRTRALNAFYAARFDHRSEREAEFLVAAALLLRREAVAEVGGFDPDFFMFDEETDLCYRLRAAGWQVVFTPQAEFVHVGGGSSARERPALYREQLRSHLRFLAKHRGAASAERARWMLVWAMRLRTLILRGERAEISREAARWLVTAAAETLIAEPAGVRRSRGGRSDH